MSVQDLKFEEIAALAHESGVIKMILFKNEGIARDLRNKYLDYFH